MFNSLSKLLLSLTIITTSSIASASLITNGSFEQLTFADNSNSQGIVFNTGLDDFSQKNRAWDVFHTLLGWVTTAGNGIELQKNIVTKSKDGTNHVELDSHPRNASNSVMTQTLDSLTIGAEYLLEFYYKPRTNNVNDNGINVFWYDSAIDFNMNMNVDFIADGRTSQNSRWAVKSVILTAQATTMDLSFGAFGRQNTYGGLLDNISLVQVNNVTSADIPEPSMFALSMFGFALLACRQLKRSK
jgi:hypothetical protein